MPRCICKKATFLKISSGWKLQNSDGFCQCIHVMFFDIWNITGDGNLAKHFAFFSALPTRWVLYTESALLEKYFKIKLAWQRSYQDQCDGS